MVWYGDGLPRASGAACSKSFNAKYSFSCCVQWCLYWYQLFCCDKMVWYGDGLPRASGATYSKSLNAKYSFFCCVQWCLYWYQLFCCGRWPITWKIIPFSSSLLCREFHLMICRPLLINWYLPPSWCGVFLHLFWCFLVTFYTVFTS